MKSHRLFGLVRVFCVAFVSLAVSASAEQVSFRWEILDASGSRSVEEVTVGESFVLQAFVQDTRLKTLEAMVAQDGIVLTEAHVAALEAAKQGKEAHGEFEIEHAGYRGSQDTFYVGTIKGVGRIYQQTFADTDMRIAFCKLYLQKHAITAADLLNGRVIPFFDEHGIPLLRVLTDRGTEYCGKKDQHEFQLYLALADLDAWLVKYNQERPYSGRYCYGKTPLQTFEDSLPLAKEKMLDSKYDQTQLTAV